MMILSENGKVVEEPIKRAFECAEFYIKEVRISFLYKAFIKSIFTGIFVFSCKIYLVVPGAKIRKRVQVCPQENF